MYIKGYAALLLNVYIVQEMQGQNLYLLSFSLIPKKKMELAYGYLGVDCI